MKFASFISAGRHIAERDALGQVFGYTCFNDGSVRDFGFVAA